MEAKRPFDILNNSLNKDVIIRLKGSVEIRGRMTSYDIHMNLVLENTEILVNGEVERKLGTMLLRGDSVIFISPNLQ
jgi:small nuclear ribonucleoprotein